MSKFNVGDKVRISNRADITDTPELAYALGKTIIITATDNFGKINNPLTMYDVAIYETGTTVAFYAEELYLIEAVQP